MYKQQSREEEDRLRNKLAEEERLMAQVQRDWESKLAKTKQEFAANKQEFAANQRVLTENKARILPRKSDDSPGVIVATEDPHLVDLSQDSIDVVIYPISELNQVYRIAPLSVAHC